MPYSGSNSLGAAVVVGGLLLFAFARPVVAGSTAATEESAASSAPATVMIASKDIHEDCRKLEVGSVLHYSFEADQALDFNIHYHDDSGVTMPVDLAGITARQGAFEAEIDQTYCLMWTSLSAEDTELRYWAE